MRTSARAGNKANKARITTIPTPKAMRPALEAVDDRVMDFTFIIAKISTVCGALAAKGWVI
jgi:hypothetical protein